jgi:hypothetical protein
MSTCAWLWCSMPTVMGFGQANMALKAFSARKTAVDRAPANGSSIAVLQEHKGVSVLLGADAHPTVLLPALKALAAHRVWRCRCVSTSSSSAIGDEDAAVHLGLQHARPGFRLRPAVEGAVLRRVAPPDYLRFLAPRPGLEPGTYGLTAPPPNGPETRANARFPGFCCLIFLPSS